MTSSTLHTMKLAQRWLLRKGKVPYYAACCTPRGATDTSEDQTRLVTYAEAERFLKIHNPKSTPQLSIGFALGVDQSGGFWQGIDLDHISDNNLDDLQAQLIGYVEKSPSGEGVHAIGYGEHFDALGSAGSGIEAYASGRFFTFTGHELSDGPLADLSTLVNNILRPRHSLNSRPPNKKTAKSHAIGQTVTKQELADLRDALKFLNSDDRHLYANAVGMSLKTIPDNKGKFLWFEWSSQSDKFDSHTAEKDWASFKPTETHWRYVFKLALKAGWKSQKDNLERHSEPVDFFEGKVPMDFDPDNCLPVAVASWVKAHARASGLEEVSFAFSALPVMAASTDRTVRINLGSGHNVPVIIWSALVGATGSGKSPAMIAAYTPLSKLHAQEVRRVLIEREKWRNENKKTRDPEPPSLNRVRYSADTTIEALTNNLSLSDGPRMLLHYDEGSGWLNDMGRYSSGADTTRSTYLSSWVGLQDYSMSRIGRGEIFVPELGVSILLGITPNKVKEGYKEASAEGLLGRTLICLIDRSRHANADRSADKMLRSADADFARMIESFTKIHDVEITLSSEAQTIYDDERRRLGNQSAKLESIYPGVAAMLAKAAENTARLAGLFKLCSSVGAFRGGNFLSQKWTIGVHEMATAKNFMSVATSHALAAYTGLLITDEPTAVARDCALKILRLHQNNREITEVEREQFMKVSTFKAADRNVQSAAIDLLNIYHWLVANTTVRQRQGGVRFGDGTRWRINPRVFDGQFEIQAQKSAADAGAVHRILTELSMEK